jgi:hypothetical protein
MSLVRVRQISPLLSALAQCIFTSQQLTAASHEPVTLLLLLLLLLRNHNL